jgi:hypothetical protein
MWLNIAKERACITDKKGSSKDIRTQIAVQRVEISWSEPGFLPLWYISPQQVPQWSICTPILHPKVPYIPPLIRKEKNRSRSQKCKKNASTYVLDELDRKCQQAPVWLRCMTIQRVR